MIKRIDIITFWFSTIKLLKWCVYKSRIVLVSEIRLNLPEVCLNIACVDSNEFNKFLQNKKKKKFLRNI